MKPSRIPACLMLASTVVLAGRTLLASSPSKVLAKVHFEQYAGTQMDWPRSTEPIALVKTSYGMPLYEKLPSRPYRVLGTMSDEGDHAIKHVAEAARLLEADALLVVGDKAFADAGLKISPQLLENAEIPDPRGPTTVSRLDHPEVLTTKDQQTTIRVTRIRAILIRWTSK
jgi:hypothetical protein